MGNRWWQQRRSLMLVVTEQEPRGCQMVNKLEWTRHQSDLLTRLTATTITITATTTTPCRLHRRSSNNSSSDGRRCPLRSEISHGCICTSASLCTHQRYPLLVAHAELRIVASVQSTYKALNPRRNPDSEPPTTFCTCTMHIRRQFGKVY
jgi:hypothetical protein